MSALKINCSSLPLYTPSAPSPRYSCEPGCDEQRLQHTPRFNRPTPTGTFMKTSGKLTVTLFEQEDDAEIPTYGRHGLVSGTVYLENCDMISRVSLKVSSVYYTIGVGFLLFTLRLRASLSPRPLKAVRNQFDSSITHILCGVGTPRALNAQIISLSLYFYHQHMSTMVESTPFRHRTPLAVVVHQVSLSTVSILSMFV
jgi:hypothetical protein